MHIFTANIKTLRKFRHLIYYLSKTLEILTCSLELDLSVITKIRIIQMLRTKRKNRTKEHFEIQKFKLSKLHLSLRVVQTLPSLPIKRQQVYKANSVLQSLNRFSKHYKEAYCRCACARAAIMGNPIMTNHTPLQRRRASTT